MTFGKKTRTNQPTYNYLPSTTLDKLRWRLPWYLCDQTIVVSWKQDCELTAEGYENGGSLSIGWASWWCYARSCCHYVLPCFSISATDRAERLSTEFRCQYQTLSAIAQRAATTYRGKNLEIKAWRISQKKKYFSSEHRKKSSWCRFRRCWWRRTSWTSQKIQSSRLWWRCQCWMQR